MITIENVVQIFIIVCSSIHSGTKFSFEAQIYSWHIYHINTHICVNVGGFNAIEEREEERERYYSHINGMNPNHQLDRMPYTCKYGYKRKKQKIVIIIIIIICVGIHSDTPKTIIIIQRYSSSISWRVCHSASCELNEQEKIKFIFITNWCDDDAFSSVHKHTLLNFMSVQFSRVCRPFLIRSIAII